MVDVEETDLLLQEIADDTDVIMLGSSTTSTGILGSSAMAPFLGPFLGSFLGSFLEPRDRLSGLLRSPRD
jgi:hypothetical protein